MAAPGTHPTCLLLSMIDVLYASVGKPRTFFDTHSHDNRVRHGGISGGPNNAKKTTLNFEYCTCLRYFTTLSCVARNAQPRTLRISWRKTTPLGASSTPPYSNKRRKLVFRAPRSRGGGWGLGVVRNTKPRSTCAH